MRFLKIFMLLSILIGANSCKKNEPKTKPETTLSKAFDRLKDIKLSAENADSLKTAWFSIYNNPELKKDTVLFADVNYNIARFYGMQNNDSAEVYVKRALEIIEPTVTNLDLKAHIYMGMGNVCNQKVLEHQANYYYNKAANIVLANDTINISPKAKTIMLLAAAQSNKSLYQLELAVKMNRAALALVNKLEPGDINRRRPLVQLAQIFLDYKMADSVQTYIQKIEQLDKDFPGAYDPDFLYETKASYYYLRQDYKNALKYHLLKKELDEEQYKNEGTNPVPVNNYYVTLVNIGVCYNLLNDNDNALAYLKNAEKVQSEHVDLISAENEILYYKTLSKIQKNTSRIGEALTSMEKAFEVQNENSYNQNMQAVAEMGSLYQLQAKDNFIGKLNENIKINQLELKENRLWLIISALVVVLLLLLFALIYYRNKQQRDNQEREKITLQQQLLRTQMEPHFIFNTLSALQSSIRLDKKEEAINYLSRFSRLLRSSLELSREQTVPLGDEIEALENYLNLQQLRFENAFEYELNIPLEQDIEMLMLPPMLIQPFVENAIIHGIDLGNANAKITLNFELNNNLLTVQIADSGKKGNVSNAIPGTSLSGTITKERIRLLGKNASVEIHQNEKGGTTVVLSIPIE